MYEVADEREGVAIWYGPFVQIPVVLYWSELSILFTDEEEPTGIG